MAKNKKLYRSLHSYLGVGSMFVVSALVITLTFGLSNAQGPGGPGGTGGMGGGGMGAVPDSTDSGGGFGGTGIGGFNESMPQWGTAEEKDMQMRGARKDKIQGIMREKNMPSTDEQFKEEYNNRYGEEDARLKESRFQMNEMAKQKKAGGQKLFEDIGKNLFQDDKKFGEDKMPKMGKEQFGDFEQGGPEFMKKAMPKQPKKDPAKIGKLFDKAAASYEKAVKNLDDFGQTVQSKVERASSEKKALTALRSAYSKIGKYVKYCDIPQNIRQFDIELDIDASDCGSVIEDAMDEVKEIIDSDEEDKADRMLELFISGKDQIKEHINTVAAAIAQAKTDILNEQAEEEPEEVEVPY